MELEEIISIITNNLGNNSYTNMVVSALISNEDESSTELRVFAHEFNSAYFLKTTPYSFLTITIIELLKA